MSCATRAQFNICAFGVCMHWVVCLLLHTILGCLFDAGLCYEENFDAYHLWDLKDSDASGLFTLMC